MEPDSTQDLQFDVPRGDQDDPDESVITDTLKQNVKEAVSGGAEEKE